MIKKLSKEQIKTLIKILIKEFNDRGIRVVSPKENTSGLYTIVYEKITPYSKEYFRRQLDWRCSMKEIKSVFIKMVLLYFDGLNKQKQEKYLQKI